MPQPTATLASVGWLHVRDGRLLAVRTRGRNRFYLPGGKPEPGETDEEALVREVREELGMQLDRVEPAFTVEAPAHGLAVETDLTLRCFRGDAAGEPRAGGEIEEVAWLRIPVDPRAAPAVHAVLARLNAERPALSR